MVVEISISTDFDVFQRLANFAIGENCFAFYVNDLKNFDLALGEERSIVIHKPENAFKKLREFQMSSKKRIAGYLGYDLKNDLERLHSVNPSKLNFPESIFFEPKAWIFCTEGVVRVSSENASYIQRIENCLRSDIRSQNSSQSFLHSIQPDTSREKYLQNAEKFRTLLKRGDIYEANYCIQFSGNVSNFNILEQFLKLHERTDAPFSVLAGMKGYYLLSASPERYLQNKGGHLISQPIKGTMKRSEDLKLDEIYKAQLLNDKKEQSENVMIVDLVRNDLSRVAKRGSVKVDELFGLKTFKTVHHLVSTVSADLNSQKFDHWDAIKASFPMGSMTGAPKISAMNLIDEYEEFKRGPYSGAFGWMDPNGDFDFNVLIRTIFYNSFLSKISFAVGSALTILAIPEKEYDECLLKARAMIDSLESSKIKDGLASEV